ncbi:MAG TPA: 1,4-alpha-glucan branching protein GlgB [Candidatus Polarisedimenticolaceae bacterium]|nr:1,4-alpha-glucan branching protein GlgB [Candidatus Polarisedimenticolaceae bacterium]
MTRRIQPFQFDSDERRLFREGRHDRAYAKLGAHPAALDGAPGVHFAVWAPRARRVSVLGEFNGWERGRHALQPVADSGVWAGFVPGVEHGAHYKYFIESHVENYAGDKADPFAFCAEEPPGTASRVWSLDYAWGDAAWMAERASRTAADAPLAIYECHLGSWRRSQPGRLPSYGELAAGLVPYLERMNFTHVELLPLMEHPFYGSWGYQVTGFFAATSRYGSPQELMALIDALHQAGIGVILDWVPSHFPSDGHGLAFFDGTHLYEHGDPRLGYHPDWKSFIFDYGRPEVRSFLLSSALFWLEHYHIDALRVDGVASMLYLDYSRKEGEFVRNRHGGTENLEAIGFLRGLNDAVHRRFPEVRTIAEESTAWPKVSRPTQEGGLGFDMKWDMGWMHDTLDYFQLDPLFRKDHHRRLTFRMLYAYSENFVLPLSHDEVVHGKGSLVVKMPGDDWQRCANLRLLLAYMTALPGKKLLFMGAELGQWREWDHERALDWGLIDHPRHAGLQRWVADLNALYRSEPALHAVDFAPGGFRWIDCGDAAQSVLVLERCAPGGRRVLAALNFTPVPREHYRIGVPDTGHYAERLNSDAPEYGGSGVKNGGALEAVAMRYHGQDHSLLLTLPPLAALFLERVAPPGALPAATS